MPSIPKVFSSTPKAAIVPLDYSKPGQGPRREYSILYFSPVWNDLALLLDDPVGRLQALEKEWPQVQTATPGGSLPPVSHVKWDILPPVSARIEPILSGLTKTTQGLDPVLAVRYQRLLSFALEDGWQPEFVENNFSLEFPPGCFLAEFAPNTSSLHITYSPPAGSDAETLKSRNEIINDPSKPPAKGRHKNQFTRTTLRFLPGTGTATGHFDIGTAKAHRTDFILDHLENPARTCQRMNTENLEMFTDNSQLIHKKGNIVLAPLPGVSPTGYFNYGRTPDEVVPPTVYVESLGQPTENYVCGMVPVIVDPGPPEFYYFSELTLKAYPYP